MKRATLLVLALVLCFTIAAQSAEAPPRLQTQNIQTAGIQRLGMITRNQLLLQVNKSITMEGFYYDGSIPMVLDNFERVNMDMMLPPDSYVPIVGPVPPGLQSGARISLEGVLQRPTTQDPPTVRRESLIIRIATAQKIRIIRAATTPIIARPINLERMVAIGGIIFVPRQVKYAVLIAGGANPANNHHRYWNDLKTMYNILKSSGYKAANIYVIYASGTGSDASMPVNYSATRANISTVFNQLASKMGSLDTLYIMMNDHGGGVMPVPTGGYPAGNYSGAIDTSGDEIGESYSEAAMNADLNGDGDKSDTVRIDETLCLWYDSITDDQFALELNKIQNFSKIIIQMKQCFCGGFTADLTKPNRIIMASASPIQPSWAHSSLNYGEFTYWYFSALTGNKPDGSGTVNADTNGDGKVSILEAYNFARSHDTRPEMPYYEDNGVLPYHSGAMPAGGDGALGATTYL